MEKSKLRKNMNNVIEDEENIDFNEYEDLMKKEGVSVEESLLTEETKSIDEVYGFIPLDIARQAKINLYAFLYYKFTNEKLRNNTKDIIAQLINESLGNIANTGQIKKYYNWDKHFVISEIGFILLKWLDEYNPYYEKGKTIPFVPFFRKKVNLHLRNEYNKRKKEEEILLSTEDLSVKNPDAIGTTAEEWDSEVDSYAYRFIQCLYSLCDAENFKKFYEKNRKGVDETRKPYFKMFLTGDVISLIKNCEYDDFYKFVLPSQEKFEKELENGFIDYVYIEELIDHCFNNLRDTDFKTYGELGFEVSENSTKSLPNERLDLPFQHNVYAKYANKTEENIHDMYYEKVRKDNGKISVIQGYKYFFNEFMGIDEER